MYGRVYWNEILTSDLEAAKAFYGKVMGWSFAEMPMSGGTYWLIMKPGEDAPVAGMMAFTGDDAHKTDTWFTYLAVENVDQSAQAVAENGGSVTRQPFDIPGVGRIAIIRDATGTPLGLISPAQ